MLSKTQALNNIYLNNWNSEIYSNIIVRNIDSNGLIVETVDTKIVNSFIEANTECNMKLKNELIETLLENNMPA